MFIIIISTSNAHVNSMPINDYIYIFSSFLDNQLIQILPVARASTAIFCNDSHTNYKISHLHFSFGVDKEIMTST